MLFIFNTKTPLYQVLQYRKHIIAKKPVMYQLSCTYITNIYIQSQHIALLY